MDDIEREEIKRRYRVQNQELLTHVMLVKEEDDNSSFNTIKDKLKNYIISQTNKFFINGYTSDDIEQECLIALRFKAINDYNMNKGPFIKFAKLCIRRHLITELKACKKKKNLALNSAMSLDEYYEDDEKESNFTLMDMVNNDDKSHFDLINIQEKGRFMYNQLARKLTKLEYKILVYYIKGYNYMEIVNLLNGELEELLKTDDVEKAKKVVDNALCRIKKKALEIEEKMKTDKRYQGDMFMDLGNEIV